MCPDFLEKRHYEYLIQYFLDMWGLFVDLLFLKNLSKKDARNRPFLVPAQHPLSFGTILNTNAQGVLGIIDDGISSFAISTISFQFGFHLIFARFFL